jgi:site-specific DNA-methyltransferase (adenine-specific)
VIPVYYADDSVTLIHGDCRDVLPALGQRFNAAVADPPYKATPLSWDRWPSGWLAAVAEVTDSLWCFGNLRMFGTRWSEFAASNWKLSHDAVGEFEVDTVAWEKHNGSGFAKDRLRGVHELIAHWYRGCWAEVHHEVPRVPGPEKLGGGRVKSRGRTAHLGAIEQQPYAAEETRLLRSVIRCRSANHRAIHPTQKPTELLVPLIEYAVRPGGVVLDPVAGSGSTGVAAKLTGRHAVLIEADEAMCEKSARWLAESPLPIGGVA